MRFKNNVDKKYYSNYMRSTESLIDTLSVSQFVQYLEKNAEQEGTVKEYIEGKVVECKAFDFTEAGSSLHKEFLVAEDGRLFYWLSVSQKMELVD